MSLYENKLNKFINAVQKRDDKKTIDTNKNSTENTGIVKDYIIPQNNQKKV